MWERRRFACIQTLFPSFTLHLRSLLSLLILAGTAAAEAQTQRASIDLGTSGVRYADSVSVSALTASPAIEFGGSRGTFAGMGTLSQSSGSSTYSGTLFGSLTTSSARRFTGEIGGSAGGSSHSDGSATGQMMGTGRVYLNASRGGAWLGAGLGQTSDGAVWRSVSQGSLGAWVVGSAGTAVVNAMPTMVADSIRYTDAVVTLLRNTQHVELSATIGSRFGDPLPSLATDRTWGGVSATWWLSPRMGLIAGAGTYPIDFTQGFPGGRYLSLALRLQRERRSPAAAAAVEAAPSGAVRAFEARRRGGVHELRVHAPGASRVEVTGDFTGWAAVALAPVGGGWWSTSRAIGSGAHEMNVRVNGGAWEPPPGLVAIRDEFGGTTGLLVIP